MTSPRHYALDLFEITLTAKQELQVQRLLLGSGPPPTDVREGAVQRQHVTSATLTACGDYLAWCGHACGMLALFNLGKTPITLVGNELRVSVAHLAAGERLSLRFLVVAAPSTVAPDAGWVEAFRRQCRLDGHPPSLVRNVTLGHVLSQQVLFDGRRRGTRLRGVVLPHSLPIALPILVTHLHPHWSAGLYDRTTHRYRPLGMDGATAYAVLEGSEPQSIFLGHPFLADQPALILQATQTGKAEFTVEVHNPTDKQLTTTISPAKEFDLVGKPSRRLTLAPGSSQIVIFNGKSEQTQYRLRI